MIPTDSCNKTDIEKDWPIYSASLSSRESKD